jgi:hypothetical protein
MEYTIYEREFPSSLVNTYCSFFITVFFPRLEQDFLSLDGTNGFKLR